MSVIAATLNQWSLCHFLAVDFFIFLGAFQTTFPSGRARAALSLNLIRGPSEVGNLRIRHAHDLIRHAIGFLFESIAGLVDSQLRLDETPDRLVPDRPLKLLKCVICSSSG